VYPTSELTPPQQPWSSIRAPPNLSLPLDPADDPEAAGVGCKLILPLPPTDIPSPLPSAPREEDDDFDNHPRPLLPQRGDPRRHHAHANALRHVDTRPSAPLAEDLDEYSGRAIPVRLSHASDDPSAAHDHSNDPTPLLHAARTHDGTKAATCPCSAGFGSRFWEAQKKLPCALFVAIAAAAILIVVIGKALQGQSRKG
jgi:hypothetical protein